MAGAADKWRIRKFSGFWWLFAPGEAEPVRCASTHKECVYVLRWYLGER